MVFPNLYDCDLGFIDSITPIFSFKVTENGWRYRFLGILGYIAFCYIVHQLSENISFFKISKEQGDVWYSCIQFPNFKVCLYS